MIKEAIFNGNSLVCDYLNKENDLKKYFKKSYKYDSDKLSDIIIRKDNGYYKNLTTQITDKNCKSVKRENKRYVLLFQSYQLKEDAYFFEYNEQYNVIILFYCNYSNAKTWHNIKAQGIITPDQIYYYFYGKKKCILSDKMKDAKANSLIESGSINDDNILYQETNDIFRKCIGNGFTSTDFSVYDFSETSYINDYIKECPIKYNACNKSQKTIDDINSYSVEDFNKNFSDKIKKNIIDFVNNSIPNGPRNNSIYFFNSYLSKISIIQNLKNGYSVIRIFKVGIKNFNSYTQKRIFDYNDLTFFEYGRIYLTEKKNYFAKFSNGKWIKIKNCFNNVTENFGFIIVYYEDVSFVNNKLKYFEDLLEENEENLKENLKENLRCWSFTSNKKLSRKLYFLLEFPVMEKLYKLQLHSYVDNIVDDFSTDTFKKKLEGIFGEIDLNQKTLQKIIGCPLYMIKKTNDDYYDNDDNYDYCYTSINIIKYMKIIYKNNINYFKTMDSKYFEELYLLLVKLDLDEDVDVIYTISNMVTLYGHKNAIEYAKYIISILKRNNSYYRNIKYCFIDYINMIYELYNTYNNEEVLSLPWNFKDFEDILVAHEDILDIYNLYSDEEKYKSIKDSFNNQINKWKKYEYKNYQFVILYPSSPSDITKEGLSLKHCVKSYLDSVAEGKTTILFIRRKEEPDKPFFTLEVKDNKVRQCHGFANCNTSTIPKLDDFLKSFCLEKNIIYSNSNDILAAN